MLILLSLLQPALAWYLKAKDFKVHRAARQG